MILLSLIYCCLLLRSFTKADTPITRKNVPNVGSAVQLGELYDATRDVLLISNLYTKETIEEKSTDLESKSAIYLEAVHQNLLLINGCFTTIPYYFLANYINIFHKIEIHTVILRGLNHHCFKSYDTNVNISFSGIFPFLNKNTHSCNDY